MTKATNQTMVLVMIRVMKNPLHAACFEAKQNKKAETEIGFGIRKRLTQPVISF